MTDPKILKVKKRVPIKCDECDEVIGYLMPSPEMVERLCNFLNYCDINAFCPKCEQNTQEVSYN
jgi:hypothetical protein